MFKTFNFLGLFSLFSVLGLLGLIGNYDTTISLYFLYVLYVGYFFVKPDELFWKYVNKAGAITMIVTLVYLSIWMSIYYLVTPSEAFISLGFWITLMLMNVLFNILLSVFFGSERASE